MFSKEFMTYLLSIDNENAPKKEEEQKEINFRFKRCLNPIYIEVRNK